MKNVIHSPLWALFVMAGLLGCMPAIPRYVTFIDSNPRWSWEGQWEGRGGMTVDFVQEGSHISFRKQVLLSVVSMDAEVTGNRAVGTISTSNPESPTLASPPDSQGAAATIHTVASALNAVAQKLSGVPFPLSLVMSDDGMFLKGEVSDPITHEITFRRIGSPADLWTRISGPPGTLVNDAGHIGSAPREETNSEDTSLQTQPTGAATVSPEAGNVLTIERFQAWTHDNAYAAEQKLQAMGMINIRGRVDRVSAKDIILVGDTEIHPKIVCQFRELARSYGQPFFYATPAEASSLRRDDLVTVVARFRKYLFPSKSTALFEDCRIVQIVPAAQAGRAQTSAPQMGAVSQVPTGASQSSPPAGYYQCYRLTVAISANTCKLGDLQLNGQGNYSSTAGPGGTYVFDPAAGVVSFNGGLLNRRMARAKISNKGTYMLRMRPDGNGLPSPKQTFGTYTFEHKSSGYRERW